MEASFPMSFERWEKKARPVDLSASRITFLSDAHLGATIRSAQPRDDALRSFLEELPEKTDRIVFLGDMFDFWIEYDGWIRPELRPFVHVLEALSYAGVRLDYVPGNHDFSIESVLKKTCNVTIHPPCIEFRLFGKRFFASHGDRLTDTGCHHRILRRILWHPANLRLYKRLPRSSAIRLALWFSALSRNSKDCATQIHSSDAMRRIGLSLLQSGYDGVVLAHTHMADTTQWNGGQYCNTGQWLHRYTYVTLDRQGLMLHEFFPHPK